MISKDLFLNGYGVARVEKKNNVFIFYIHDSEGECYKQVDQKTFLEYLEELNGVYEDCKEFLEFLAFLNSLLFNN